MSLLHSRTAKGEWRRGVGSLMARPLSLQVSLQPQQIAFWGEKRVFGARRCKRPVYFDGASQPAPGNSSAREELMKQMIRDRTVVW